MDNILFSWLIYSIGVITGLVVAKVLCKGSKSIEVTVLRPPREACAAPTNSPSVIHLTPEREANFAKTHKESEGDY